MCDGDLSSQVPPVSQPRPPEAPLCQLIGWNQVQAVPVTRGALCVSHGCDYQLYLGRKLRCPPQVSLWGELEEQKCPHYIGL